MKYNKNYLSLTINIHLSRVVCVSMIKRKAGDIGIPIDSVFMTEVYINILQMFM